MTSVIIAGFFTVIGAFVGSWITQRVQIKLREEKFKEIVYKEKFAVYKDLLNRLWDLQAATIQYRLMKDTGFHAGVGEHMELQKVMEKSDEFSNCLAGRSFIITESVGAKTQQLWLECIKAVKAKSEDPGIDWEPAAKFAVIKEKHEIVIKAMRDEFEIPRIERSIKKTFSGGMKSFVDVFADGIALILKSKKN